MGVMHARAREVLRELAALPRDHEDAEILCDGITCYFGVARLHRRTVDELLRATAISESWSSGNSIYYTLNDTGRAIARRPELADEVFARIVSGKGAFSISDDQIVAI